MFISQGRHGIAHALVTKASLRPKNNEKKCLGMSASKVDKYLCGASKLWLKSKSSVAGLFLLPTEQGYVCCGILEAPPPLPHPPQSTSRRRPTIGVHAIRVGKGRRGGSRPRKSVDNDFVESCTCAVFSKSVTCHVTNALVPLRSSMSGNALQSI